MKRLMLMSGVLLSLSLLGAPASAQTGAARGKVVDDKGQAMVDAKIEIDYQGGMTRKFETKTNKKGEFTQVGLGPGQYRITASKDGYQPSYIDTRIGLGDPTQLPDFKLVPRAAAGAAGGADGGAGAELQALFQKGYELTQAGKLDEAEAAYKEILVKDAAIPAVHYNLGVLYTQKKDWAGAEAAYKKALELKPGYSEATSALVRVYNDSGQQDKAMVLLTQAGGESDPKIQFNLGVTHLNAQRLDEAEAAFKKVESLEPTNAEVHYHLGTIALNQGKSDVAVQRLEKYLSMSPQNAQNVATAQGLLQALKPKK